jgi:hypothetical protein
MKILKWIKENVFDWSPVPPVRVGHRPPEHHPGYKNIQRVSRRPGLRPGDLNPDKKRKKGQGRHP